MVDFPAPLGPKIPKVWPGRSLEAQVIKREILLSFVAEAELADLQGEVLWACCRTSGLTNRRRRIDDVKDAAARLLRGFKLLQRGREWLDGFEACDRRQYEQREVHALDLALHGLQAEWPRAESREQHMELRGLPAHC